MQVAFLGILVLYLISLYALGSRAIKIWLPGFPVLLNVVGAFLVGTGIGVPVTYGITCLVAKTAYPIFLGTVLSTVLIALLLFFWKNKIPNTHKQRLSCSDIALVVLSLAFSSWMMIKTFHGDSSGQLYVGSNNIFDSGHALGIIRSFSWGSNIPLTSPFESGSPFFYNFFFLFFVAIWEYFGVPIVWAVNIPSVLSFAALLIVVYFLPQIAAKQEPFVGWIAVLLTVTNSSLTFLQVLMQKGLSWKLVNTIWNLPGYPFAGPFDGSTISLFITLNNYVNQRHLAFSIALGLFLCLLTLRALGEKTIRYQVSILIGAVTGFLFLWNIAICPLVFLTISILLLSHKKWSAFAIFAITAAGAGFIINLPNIMHALTEVSYLGVKAVINNKTPSMQTPTWTIIDYLWQNLGIVPIIAGLGYMVLPKKSRVLFFPIFTLFILECIFAGFGKRGFDQKFYSFLIIGINILAAIGVVWIWRMRSRVLKLTAILIFGVLTVSGVIDLMPIKNEFAFPIVNKQILPIISWIHTHTIKDDVFVSYADIIDPVVLAGRKNYFGFFGNIGWKIRTDSVERIYSGDIALAKREGIGYILVPRFTKTDFPYHVDVAKLLSVSSVVYEDTDFLVFRVQ